MLGTLLQWELVDNSGAAFSLGRGFGDGAGIFLSLISILALAAIFIFARSITSRKWGVALGLLAGGICGNLSDRIFRSPYWFRGEVVDWIKVPHWPVFNFADSSILLSAVAIALLLMNNVKPRTFDE